MTAKAGRPELRAPTNTAGAGERDLPDPPGPREKLSEPQGCDDRYIHITYGPWDSSGHQCGDLTPGGCDEPIPLREVTMHTINGAQVIGCELGDCPNRCRGTEADPLHTAIELVLLDHADQIVTADADPNLSELAYAYRKLTGWTVDAEEPHAPTDTTGETETP